MSSHQHHEAALENQAGSPDESEPDAPDEGRSLRDRIIPIAVLGIVVALLVVLGVTLYQPSSSNLGAGGRVNTAGNAIAVDEEPAPDFTLQTFDGEEVTLSDFRGKNVVINFWASWCPPCREEAPILNEFHEANANGGDTVLLGVAIWDEDADSRQFMEQYNLQFTNLSDPRGSVLIDYGVYGIPETYFIDEEGNLVGKYRGPLESVEQINDLQAQFEQGQGTS